MVVPTPAGEYALGAAEHHTSMNWPMSVVPDGAKLRRGTSGWIEFSGDDGASWKTATGRDGLYTKAAIQFMERDEAQKAKREGRPAAALQDWVKAAWASDERPFVDAAGNVLPVYVGNDFGLWAFDLIKNG